VVPAEAVVVGPLHFEPTTMMLEVPPGDGPVVVVKETGETFHLGSTPAFDLQLAEYAKDRGLPPPPPLGW